MDKGQGPRDGVFVKDSIPQNRISLGDLAERLQLFWKQRVSFVTPDLSNRFDRQLYSTLVSHIEPPDWEYPLDQKSDSRGTLAEFLKSQSVGQIFLSRTKPGVTRGTHFHHSKTEKFLVVEGEGMILLRREDGTDLHEHRVRGEDFRVVEIPPGYAHSITNVGVGDMVTLFWANEIFDPEDPDTWRSQVVPLKPGETI